MTFAQIVFDFPLQYSQNICYVVVVRFNATYWNERLIFVIQSLNVTVTLFLVPVNDSCLNNGLNVAP